MPSNWHSYVRASNHHKFFLCFYIESHQFLITSNNTVFFISKSVSSHMHEFIIVPPWQS